MKKSHVILFISSLISVFFYLNSMANDPHALGPAKDLLSKITEFNEKLISHPKQLTFVGGKSGEGYFSRDGKKMIFQSERFDGNPFYQMYLMDLTTGKTDLLSTGKGKTTCGWIHPSLKKVMWSSTHLDPEAKNKQLAEIESRKKPVQGKYSWSFDEYFDIFESDLQGKNVKRLTKALGYDAEGAYSSNGKEIVFASNRTGYSDKLTEEEKKLFIKDPSSQMEIYTMKADGSDVKRLTQHIGYDGGPFFSNDGKKITWRRFDASGATAEIYVMNRDGSDQKQVTSLNAMSWAPFFHPSGKYLIFTSSITGFSNFELFIVDVEGKKKPVRVTYEDDFDGLPTFSPDGSKISWTHRNQKGESQIFIADWNHEKALEQLGLNEKFKVKLADLKLSPSIELKDSKEILQLISSADFNGRLSGSLEEKELNAEITQLFKNWNLKTLSYLKTYEQNFEIITGIELVENNSLSVNNQTWTLGKDFKPLSLSQSGKFKGEALVFAGYGIKAPASESLKAYDSYENKNVKDKWVVIFKDLPSKISKDLRNHLLPYARIAHKITLLKNLGARGVLFVDSSLISQKDVLSKTKFDGSQTGIPVVEITLDKFLEIFNLTEEQYSKILINLDNNQDAEAIPEKAISLEAEVNLKLQKKLATQIIGYIEAGKKTNKSILIGAHMDHLGQGEIGNSLANSNDSTPIHFGADDNASGVTGVLELAHYFSKNRHKLQYNTYFALWSGEEMGVLGSHYFADNWEEVTKKKLNEEFIVTLNMDMIGRLQNHLQIQGIGSSGSWPALIEELALQNQISVIAQKDPYLPTDSITFYLKDIPSISFFTGVHTDYHSPRDIYEKINYEGLIQVVKLVKAFTEKINQLPADHLKFEKVEGAERSKGSERSFRIYLGTIPDYSQEGVTGVRVSGVSKNSPAEKAGILAKDIIVEFNGKTIESIHDYVFGLQSAEPKKEITIKIRRGVDTVSLKITPELKPQ